MTLPTVAVAKQMNLAKKLEPTLPKLGLKT
jgi:hypothetical protein